MFLYCISLIVLEKMFLLRQYVLLVTNMLTIECVPNGILYLLIALKVDTCMITDLTVVKYLLYNVLQETNKVAITITGHNLSDRWTSMFVLPADGVLLQFKLCFILALYVYAHSIKCNSLGCCFVYKIACMSTYSSRLIRCIHLNLHFRGPIS